MGWEKRKKEKKSAYLVHPLSVLMMCWLFVLLLFLLFVLLFIIIEKNYVNPFRTAVPICGQTSQIPSILSPKRDCGSKRVKVTLNINSWYNTRHRERTHQVHQTKRRLDNTISCQINTRYMVDRRAQHPINRTANLMRFFCFFQIITFTFQPKS